MSAEYRLVWIAKLERILPVGHSIIGDRLPEGRGSTPENALVSLRTRLDDERDDLDCLDAAAHTGAGWEGLAGGS